MRFQRSTTLAGPSDPYGLQPALPLDAVQQRRFQPSSRAALALRIALIVCFCVAVLYTLTVPAERNIDHLLVNLSDGNVESMTIERPTPDVQGQLQLRVDWTQSSGRDGYAHYPFDSLGDEQVDDGALILQAAAGSPVPVDVTVIEGMSERPAMTLNLLGLASIAIVLVLIAGPQTRLATKWAWFWLGGAVPVLWLAYLALEPVPLWRREPMLPSGSRITGGWAFLLALVLDSVWQGLGWL